MAKDQPVDVYRPALDALEQSGASVYGPLSFQAYLAEHKLPQAKTATAISIDSYERLATSLKQNDAMVFRLGIADGTPTTQFAIVRIPGRLKDFFLIDDEIFAGSEGTTFLPRTSIRTLYAYHLLPAYSEASLLNLALSSGLLSTALGLDEPGGLPAPATGQSTFTFEFRFHSTLSKAVKHVNGQVQTDAVFIEARQGRDMVFVIEAKTDSADRSLAKHKLAYALLALSKHVPQDMPIIPVYLRIARQPDGLHFHVVECVFPDPREVVCAIDELAAQRMALRHTHLILRRFTE